MAHAYPFSTTIFTKILNCKIYVYMHTHTNFIAHKKKKKLKNYIISDHLDFALFLSVVFSFSLNKSTDKKS